MNLPERLRKLRNESKQHGDFCVCGNVEATCPYHRPTGAGRSSLSRAADLLALLEEDHHEIDYDSCSIDTPGAVETIAAFLRGEDNAHG